MMRLSYAVTLLALIAGTEAFAQQPGYYLYGARSDSAIAQQPAPTTGYYLQFRGVNSDSAIPVERRAKRAGPSPQDDPLAAYFFPPELIMTHQSELGLQDAQRATMMSEIQKAQARFIELQWKMSAETERLKALLEPPVADETKVLEQIDRTLAVEREIKRVQVALLVRIKNTLTPSQQAKLTELRDNGNAN
jgi:Spy/CpxP family protein refolding chaperone